MWCHSVVDLRKYLPDMTDMHYMCNACMCALLPRTLAATSERAEHALAAAAAVHASVVSRLYTSLPYEEGQIYKMFTV